MGLSLFAQYGINASAAAGIVIEPGLIVQYYGLTTSIPEDWLLCDGTNGTPNLIDKFIVGAGDIYSIGNTGGFKDSTLVSHTHIGTLSTTGSHSHTLGISSNFFFGSTVPRNAFTFNSAATATSSSAGNHTHTVTVDSEGQSEIDGNLPPYLSLIYIMKGGN